ncbi:hypothetical protein BU24DRAFT_461787 [Aaosphaeria arxii CBS 175.79]|uniref:AMP-activated protein kinase glycogen-binding domain-containing protein n=1 Tax=Aaosphaeria arxii CBS 175.79 TaxID=1450172 RepID=A0A6A5XQH5_9PLEO|nr:uncharacterized protein BU24DRAFT_461787 [Aaosphaeria arxii CBS 175.79]KAF2015545.1 hypothetical protein BU24DRAFT_461787 [Aaosphaeria arxii CBS 175.79]
MATVTFVHPGVQGPVFIVSSMSNPEWQVLQMSANERSEYDSIVFSYTFNNVAEGIYQYKIRIGDGQWVVDESEETDTDEAGNRNNVYRVVSPEKSRPDQASKADLAQVEANLGEDAMLHDRIKEQAQPPGLESDTPEVPKENMAEGKPEHITEPSTPVKHEIAEMEPTSNVSETAPLFDYEAMDQGFRRPSRSTPPRGPMRTISEGYPSPPERGRMASIREEMFDSPTHDELNDLQYLDRAQQDALECLLPDELDVAPAFRPENRASYVIDIGNPGGPRLLNDVPLFPHEQLLTGPSTQYRFYRPTPGWGRYTNRDGLDVWSCAGTGSASQDDNMAQAPTVRASISQQLYTLPSAPTAMENHGIGQATLVQPRGVSVDMLRGYSKDSLQAVVEGGSSEPEDAGEHPPTDTIAPHDTLEASKTKEGDEKACTLQSVSAKERVPVVYGETPWIQDAIAPLNTPTKDLNLRNHSLVPTETAPEEEMTLCSGNTHGSSKDTKANEQHHIAATKDSKEQRTRLSRGMSSLLGIFTGCFRASRAVFVVGLAFAVYYYVYRSQ